MCVGDNKYKRQLIQRNVKREIYLLPDFFFKAANTDLRETYEDFTNYEVYCSITSIVDLFPFILPSILTT